MCCLGLPNGRKSHRPQNTAQLAGWLRRREEAPPRSLWDIRPDATTLALRTLEVLLDALVAALSSVFAFSCQGRHRRTVLIHKLALRILGRDEKEWQRQTTQTALPPRRELKEEIWSTPSITVGWYSLYRLVSWSLPYFPPICVDRPCRKNAHGTIRLVPLLPCSDLQH